jgi:hypothetical protein
MSDEKEKLAAWMIKNSFATGHGDTFDDLLKELTWQVNELRQQSWAVYEAKRTPISRGNSP